MTDALAKAARLYSRFGKNSTKKLINIVRIDQPLYNDAIAFMQNNYLDDPLLRAMGISLRHKDTQHFLSKLWLTLLKSELSLAAMHRKTMCGICVNCPRSVRGTSQDVDPTYLELAKQTRTPSTRNLLLAWDKIERETVFPRAKLKNRPKSNPTINILELAFCTVDQYYRRLGIAKKLIKNTADLAMLLGFEYVRIDCTHMATAKICNEFGWELVGEMPFQSFHGVVVDFFPKDYDPAVKVFVKNVKVDVPKQIKK